jgi:hypothetical protein
MAFTITPKPIVDAQLIPAAQTLLYTVPANTYVIIDKATACNTDSSTAKKLDVWLVPAAGSIGDANRIIYELSISSKATEDITKLQNQILGPGDKVYANAETAAKINFRVSGRTVLSS